MDSNFEKNSPHLHKPKHRFHLGVNAANVGQKILWIIYVVKVIQKSMKMCIFITYVWISRLLK